MLHLLTSTATNYYLVRDKEYTLGSNNITNDTPNNNLDKNIQIYFVI
jgi:hypothetical protein